MTNARRKNLVLWIKMLDGKWNPVEIKVSAEDIPNLKAKWSDVFRRLGTEPTEDRFRIESAK